MASPPLNAPPEADTIPSFHCPRCNINYGTLARKHKNRCPLCNKRTQPTPDTSHGEITHQPAGTMRG